MRGATRRPAPPPDLRAEAPAGYFRTREMNSSTSGIPPCRMR